MEGGVWIPESKLLDSCLSPDTRGCGTQMVCASVSPFINGDYKGVTSLCCDEEMTLVMSSAPRSLWARGPCQLLLLVKALVQALAGAL